MTGTPSPNPLAILVGQKLALLLPADSQTLALHFGAIRRESGGIRGAHVLELRCAWRFSCSRLFFDRGGIVIGSRDRWQYGGIGLEPENWDDDDGASAQHRFFDHFIGAYDDGTGAWFNERERFVVEEAAVQRRGEIRLRLGNGYQFQAFPDGGVRESWRFFADGAAAPVVYKPQRDPRALG